MNGRTCGLVCRRTDGWKELLIDGWMDRMIGRRMDGCADRQMDGRKCCWLAGWMDGRYELREIWINPVWKMDS